MILVLFDIILGDGNRFRRHVFFKFSLQEILAQLDTWMLELWVKFIVIGVFLFVMMEVLLELLQCHLILQMSSPLPLASHGFFQVFHDIIDGLYSLFDCTLQEYFEVFNPLDCFLFLNCLEEIGNTFLVDTLVLIHHYLIILMNIF